MTSDLVDELSFTLNGDPIHRGKVRSLIPPKRKYKPKKVELWVFKDYAWIMPHSFITSNSMSYDDDKDIEKASDFDESVESERHKMNDTKNPFEITNQDAPYSILKKSE